MDNNVRLREQRKAFIYMKEGNKGDDIANIIQEELNKHVFENDVEEITS